MVEVNEAIVFVPLTQGKIAICDFEDWHAILRHHKWCAWTGNSASRRANRFYACTVKKKPKMVRWCMHNLIMGIGILIDHINRNSLDNRRCNLRACTHAENMRNRTPRPGLSGFIGVSLNHGKWQSSIRLNGERYYLGKFDSPIEAAMVRDEKAKELHGEFAVLNFN